MGTKQSILAVVFGLCTTLIIILGSSFILSILLKFTEIQESALSLVIIAVSFLALFIGGFVSGGKGKEKGWLSGGGTGLFFTLLVFLVQFLGYQATFSLEQTLFHIGYIVIAVLGGIIGVNLTSKRA